MDESGERRATAREYLGVAVVLAALIVGTLVTFGSQIWTRPFWADEMCCTVYVLQDSHSLLDVLRNVQRYDVAPPLLHLMAWCVGKIAGGFTPGVLRGMATVSVALTVMLLYGTLRRHFGRLASAAGASVVLSNNLVIYHALNARFYGPWLAFAALYAWSFGLAPSRRRAVLQAGAAIGVCLIHWYGVIALALMAGGVVAWHGWKGAWRDGLRAAAPSIAGVIALAAFAPMLLAQTRQSREILDWVPPVSWIQLAEQGLLFWFTTPALAALAIIAVMAVAKRPTPVGAVIDSSLVALISLALMPLVLLAMSIAITPVLIPRYAAPAALAVAPLIAYAVQRAPRVLAFGMLALNAWLMAREAGPELRRIQWFDMAMREYRAELALVARDSVPIVFPSFYTIYPVAGPDRQRTPARFLELPDSVIGKLYYSVGREPDRRALRMERSFAQLHSRVFGFPMPIALEQLTKARRFYLFSIDITVPRRSVAQYGRVVFPGYAAVRLTPYLTQFQR